VSIIFLHLCRFSFFLCFYLSPFLCVFHPPFLCILHSHSSVSIILPQMCLS
jgi:hypothetical protein